MPQSSPSPAQCRGLHILRNGDASKSKTGVIRSSGSLCNLCLAQASADGLGGPPGQRQGWRTSKPPPLPPRFPEPPLSLPLSPAHSARTPADPYPPASPTGSEVMKAADTTAVSASCTASRPSTFRMNPRRTCGQGRRGGSGQEGGFRAVVSASCWHGRGGIIKVGEIGLYPPHRCMHACSSRSTATFLRPDPLYGSACSGGHATASRC